MRLFHCTRQKNPLSAIAGALLRRSEPLPSVGFLPTVWLITAPYCLGGALCMRLFTCCRLCSEQVCYGCGKLTAALVWSFELYTI